MIICAISTLFVNNIGFYFLRLMIEFWVLKKIRQNCLTMKYILLKIIEGPILSIITLMHFV